MFDLDIAINDQILIEKYGINMLLTIIFSFDVYLLFICSEHFIQCLFAIYLSNSEIRKKMFD